MSLICQFSITKSPFQDGQRRGHNLSSARREAALLFLPLCLYSRRMPDVDMTASTGGGTAHYETGEMMINVLRQQTVRLSSFLSWEGARFLF